MNAAVMQAAPTIARATQMPRGRLFRAYVIEAKYESLRMLRSPAFSIPFLGLPVLLYLLFAVLLFGEAIKKDPLAPMFMFLGFTVFGVLGPGLFGFGVTIAMEREQRMLALKRALPAPTTAPYIAKMLMAMLFVAIIMVTMIAAAPLGHVHVTFSQMLSLSLTAIIGSLPFCAMGLFIGTLASAKSAPAFINLAYLPMIYLSGFLIPMPKSMQWIELVSPAFYLHQIALHSLGMPSYGNVFVNIAVLGGLTLVLTALAVRRLARIG